MLANEPSRTAIGAAAHRATHQLIEGGALFNDPLAIPILGIPPEELRRIADEEPRARGLRFFIAARSALAEAKLAEAVEERGVAQLVVLGAGLDTFAYRSPFGDRLAIFELDHPATQAWKRQRLKAAGIDAPDFLSFVPVELETTTLNDALAQGGFDFGKRSFFMWLGTVPYLTHAAIVATLETVGGLASGAEIVFDYAEPLAHDSSGADERLRALSERVAAAGEPFVTFFEPPAVHALLKSAGLPRIEDYNVRALAEHFWGSEVVAERARAGTPFPERGGHVLFASTG